MTHAVAINTTHQRTYRTIADDAGNGESHKEMLERHQLFEIDGKGREVDGEAEGTQHCGQIESLQIERGRHVEVHHHLIGHHTHAANGEQRGILQLEALHPIHREQTA